MIIHCKAFIRNYTTYYKIKYITVCIYKMIKLKFHSLNQCIMNINEQMVAKECKEYDPKLIFKYTTNELKFLKYNSQILLS